MGMDMKQLVELAKAADDTGAVNRLAEVLSKQNDILAEALVRQNAESMLRLESMASKALEQVVTMARETLNRQLTLLSPMSARQHATLSRARPARSVDAPRRSETSPSAGQSGAGDFGSDDDEQIVEISGEDIIAQGDPFGIGRSHAAHIPPR